LVADLFVYQNCIAKLDPNQSFGRSRRGLKGDAITV